MTRTAALNGLFLLATCTSAAVETILYRLALVAIVVMLGALWTRARIKRAFNERTVVREELVRLGSGNASRRIQITPIHISHKNK